MNSSKKKDNNHKQKTNNKNKNNSNHKNGISNDAPSDSHSFNTSDSTFLQVMEQLVSNDKTIRENAALKTKKYLHESYSNNEELFQKISKSLFYFYFNTDKSAYQLSMAKLISSFIYINEDDKTKLIPKYKLWISTFLSEISKKFQSIDVLRLDKYIMMCDQVMSTYLSACLENKLYKSILYLIKYFIKETENNNNFNFTFESNKINVLSRFIQLILSDNQSKENELKNKDDYLNNEENGFNIFYQKLLEFYANIKDKRETKLFSDKIFEVLINGLINNKKENKNIINKIREETESFLEKNKPLLNGPKILGTQYFINKLKDEKYQKPIKEDTNVVDPVNDYIMKKNYMAKFKKSKEEIKKERLLEKEKKKELKNKEKEKEERNESDKKEKRESDKKEKRESDKKEKKDSDKKEKKDSDKKEKKDDKKNSDKKDKKEKINKLENISKELDFDNIKVEKELINLDEGEEEKEDNEDKQEKDEEEDQEQEEQEEQQEKERELEQDEEQENQKDIQQKKLKNKKEDINNKIKDKKEKKEEQEENIDINKKKQDKIELKEIKKSKEKNEKKEDKEKEGKKEKKEKNKKDKKVEKALKTEVKNSSDDESLIEDTDEDEELLEENDDDDDDDSENNNINNNNKNKKSKESIKFQKEEDLENNEEMEEDEIDNDEDKLDEDESLDKNDEDDDDDEEYELNEDDLEDYGNDLNFMINPYNDKKTLKNTQLNMKQGLLNKKTQRNFVRNNTNKNKKKKISFSLENNVVSIYNNKVPITLTSKKKNVLAQGATTRQSLLKKK